MPRRFARKRTFRRPRKSNAYKRKRAYAPANKRKFVRRSNPISENKKVEASDITRDVGVNLLNTDILHDFSEEPRYVGNEPPLLGGEDLAVAGLPTGARGVPLRDAVFNFNPDSALYQTQGTDHNSMIGSSNYMKLTAAKFLIRWPQYSMNTG